MNLTTPRRSGQPSAILDDINARLLDAAEPGNNGHAQRHPLYRLPDVLAADRIYITESKQAADAARAVGLTATTSPHGVKSKTDWSPLANKAVTILPDHNADGVGYARGVARLVQAAGARSVRIVPMAAICPSRILRSGYDLADAAAECLDDDERMGLRMAVEEAEAESPAIESLRADETDADYPLPPDNDGDELPEAENHGRGVLDVGPPVPLCDIIAAHPRLRPPVIEGLVRRGETANIIAHPKAGKSWLAAGLAISVVDGCSWLDTFPCVPGRVLIIDGELHPETLAHRLPLVARALDASPGYASQIDIWAVRGVNLNLYTIGPLLQRIEPGRYALIVLDAFYRFLPSGSSENDNAGIMALYNAIDGYAGRLGAAWANIHHTSKGNQAEKATTDVGSGAGAQSRAADTHLIMRPHEEANVAVLQAVVRSWPPVEPLAIRWEFPTWQLDNEADPTKLQRPTTRTGRADKDRHLDEDRQAIVNAMHGLGEPETKTAIRDAAQFGNPRFGYAWQSLVTDGTITPTGDKAKKDNGHWYETFTLKGGNLDL